MASMSLLGKADCYIVASGADVFVCRRGGGEVEFSVPQSRAFGGDLVGTLKELFKSDAIKRGSRVLVVSDSIFTQRVELSSAQVSGLSGKELANAVFYEIEPFVEIPRADASFDYRSISPGIFDVALAPASDVASLGDVVRQSRCRFVGLCAVSPGEISDVEDIPAVLDNIDSGNSPVLTISRGGLSVGGSLIKIAVAVSSLLALVCLCDWLWLSHTIAKLSPEVASSERMDAANSGIRQEIARLRNQARGIALRREAARQSRENLAAYRDSWLKLLMELASSSGDDIVVNRISVDDGASLSVHCLALSSSSATAAMETLARNLLPLGWSLSPNRIEALPDGISFSFSFFLTYTKEGK